MAEKAEGSSTSRGELPDESWPLRHSLLVVTGGAVVAATAFGLVFRLAGGAAFTPRFEAGLRAATAVAAATVGLLTWARLDLSRREHHLAVQAELSRSDQVVADQSLARDRDLTERFVRSVEQLGSDDIVIRVGGVFAMERFALDAFAISGAARDIEWHMALDLMAAFARERSLLLGDQTAMAPVDIVEAVRVIGRFSSRADSDEPVNISYNLTGLRLAGATIRNAYLPAADLTGADLTRARLRTAYLREANLANAKMSHAWLTGSDLVDANLYKADIRRARLPGADLSHASLNEADLSGSDLTRADLSGTDLSNATLTGFVLRRIRYTEDTAWPEGFTPPKSR